MKTKLALLLLALLWLQCRSHQDSGNENPTLENTYWKLVEVAATAVSTPQNGTEIFMILTRENDSMLLKGHAGCNGLGGDFKLEGNKIKFQPITTRMFCEGQMETENLFTRMLTAADRYELSGKTLELFAGTELLGKFEALPVK